MLRAMKIFIVTACICMSEDNGVPKRTKHAAATSSCETSPAMSTGTFEGFCTREAFCKINIVGQSSPLGLGLAARVLSFGALLADAATSCTLHNRKGE